MIGQEDNLDFPQSNADWIKLVNATDAERAAMRSKDLKQIAEDKQPTIGKVVGGKIEKKDGKTG